MENKYMNPCKICKKEISINAKICPNCGEVNPNISIEEKIKMNKLLLIIQLIPLMFILIIGSIGLYYLSKLKDIFQI